MTPPTVPGAPLLPYSDLGEARSARVGRPDGVPALLGGGCRDCGRRFFPQRAVCPACASTNVEGCRLGTRGRLYSWSVVHVSSARPTPYTLGYIDLADDVRLLSDIRGDGLRPDMPVELAVDEDGSWYFAPAAVSGA